MPTNHYIFLLARSDKKVVVVGGWKDSSVKSGDTGGIYFAFNFQLFLSTLSAFAILITAETHSS